MHARYTGATVPKPVVNLPPALEKLVAAQVKQGAYHSRHAAIVAAVTKEKRRAEQREQLQAGVQRGLESRLAGELDIKAVIRRGRRRLAARKRAALG
jgi:Arc/MetJ-type ribon-helix-helix transcriptional regulator